MKSSAAPTWKKTLLKIPKIILKFLPKMKILKLFTNMMTNKVLKVKAHNFNKIFKECNNSKKKKMRALTTQWIK